MSSVYEPYLINMLQITGSYHEIETLHLYKEPRERSSTYKYKIGIMQEVNLMGYE